jgi:hypothetical protein
MDQRRHIDLIHTVFKDRISEIVAMVAKVRKHDTQQ